MENVDITSKVKNFIRFGLIGILAASCVIGYGMFQHYHAEKILQIENAKVTSNVVSAHALTSGKIAELPFEDGDEVKAGDVIAKIEVNITEDDIKKLQQAVDTAKKNYDNLKLGQHVKTPVRRTKTVPNTTTSTTTTTSRPSASVSTLEERVHRLEELYEMGAVSKGELDKARTDLSKAKSGASTSSVTTTTPAPSTTTTVEIDYVDSIQATPAEVLKNAENAVKAAEMALNAAVQQSQQTEITAPADGIIYYSYLVGEEFQAGDVIAKIGDNKNVWIEAEVTEDIFNQISLGKKVSYTIDGHNLSGTLIEKIAPPAPEPEPVKDEEVPAEDKTETSETPAENSAEVKNENQPVETPAENKPAETSKSEPPTEENKNAEETATEDKPVNENAEEEKMPDKFIIKVSIPTERDFDLKLLSETTLKISL